MGRQLPIYGTAMFLVLASGTAAAQATGQGTGDEAASQAVPAAEAPQPRAQDQARRPSAEGGLVDIVVTAQRRAENLQRAAVAVSAVTGGDLVRAGVSEPLQLTKLIPALTVQPAGLSSSFFIRGVGSSAINSFQENAIEFSVGGVFFARPTAPSGTFYDLERVEVLKGPQGTLYGRNATGGAINLIPRAPCSAGSAAISASSTATTTPSRRRAASTCRWAT